MRHHVRRLCTSALSLICAASLASSVAAQELDRIDAHIRIVDAKTEEPIAATAFILRDATGEVVHPVTKQNGEISYYIRGRKLLIESTLKADAKESSYSIPLIDAPKIHVTMRVDPFTGRITEISQKPIPIETRPNGKIRPSGGGQANILAPPVNDACGSPTPIGNGATAFTTVEATTDGPANCLGSVFNDVWFSYVATATGSLTVSTCNAATFDTKIAIYTGLGCPPGLPIGCNDDFGGCAGFTSTATAPVVMGSTYLIRLGAFGSTQTGTGTLTITPPAGAPPFDQCATAQSVSCGSSTMFNNAGATTSGTDPIYTCRVGGPAQGFGTSWFTFVATGTNATIDTEGSSTGDTLLGVYSGTCGSLVEIACDDDAGTGFLSMVNVGGLTIGQTYYIQVAGWGAGNVGNNVLNVECSSTAPPGDACEDAIDMACGGSATVNNTTYTTDPGDPAYSCRFGGAGQGVGTAWFKFVATDTSARIDTNASTAFDTLLAVYSGTCGAFVELACDDDTGIGLLSEFCVDGLTIGETYYIQASSYSAFDTGDITVSIECPCPAPPTNDECEDAIALGAPPFSTVFDTSLATDDIGVPCGVFSGPFNNVWHTVTGTGTTITLTSCNAGTSHPDTKISVFCGECLEPVCVAGNDDNCGGFNVFNSTVSFCSQAGVQYLVTTGGFAPGQVGVVQLDATASGSACDPDVECLPVGACCLADGTCVDATLGDCEAMGGSYQGDGTDCFANAVADPSFEAGAFGGIWTESSTNFGTPLCDAGCGLGGGTGPNSGNWWAWFGGIPAFEEGSVSQSVVIPMGATTLDFWLEIPVSSGNGVDFLEVLIDGNQEFLVLENAGPFVGYTLQQVPLGAYADGGLHTIEFHSIITGTLVNGAAFTNFFVDDVAINVQETVCALPCHTLTLDDGGFSHGDSAENIVGPGLLLDVDGVSFNGDTCAPQGTAGTALVFDSTNGPFNQDPDLHVNSGNVLIVQTNSAGAVNPNDDDDGGILTFLFSTGPGVEPTSIDLIDVDAAAAETVTVTLVDGNTRTRVYTVPANWTGDVTLAQPGIGTLLLNTLAPQPGPHMGVATAVEDAGFDQTNVSIIIVNRGGCGANVNGGSGAVDNLSWCE